MRNSTRSILFLGLAAAALSAAVWFELERERADARRPLTALNPATVQRIEIRCRDCQTRRFERSSDGWRMLEPIAAAANADAVARLLAVVHAPVRTRAALRDYDATKLGLDPPQFVLTFDQVTLAIGDEDPIEHDRYVRLGDEVLRVPDRFSARLLEAPESELANPPGH
jgi:hypothetical protein